MFCVLTVYRNKCFFMEKILPFPMEKSEKILPYFFNSAYWVIFHTFCRLLIFFKFNFFEKFFQEYHQSVKQFGSRSVPTFCQPNPSPNCLQRLSADDTSRHRVNLKQFAQNLNYFSIIQTIY